jgi:hypothetical protein
MGYCSIHDFDYPGFACPKCYAEGRYILGDEKMMNTKSVIITEEMIEAAKKQESECKIDRTIASPIDTITGILGEYVFAQYYYGDWQKNNVGNNKGKIDFKDIEVKCSARPFSWNLNLLVRSDYKEKRTPKYYVQGIIDIPRESTEIPVGSTCIIVGFAYGSELEDAPKKDFGNKNNEASGYECYFISFSNLHPIEEIEKQQTLNIN